MTIALP